MKKTIAIVLAGGKGSRMNSDQPKQYLPLCGKPVLFYSVQAFEQSNVDEIVLVCAKGEENYCREILVDKYGFRKVKKVVAGGAQRYHSVHAGLEAIEEAENVLIHDGARPMITPDVINQAIAYLEKQEACVVGMPVKDTIWKVSEERTLEENPPRRLLWAAQTPQCFHYNKILDAYRLAIDSGDCDITDDAMVAIRYGSMQIGFIEGSYQNIKITTPEDLLIAEAFLSKTILSKKQNSIKK